jgi:hypothetical protein
MPPSSFYLGKGGCGTAYNLARLHLDTFNDKNLNMSKTTIINCLILTLDVFK